MRCGGRSGCGVVVVDAVWWSYVVMVVNVVVVVVVVLCFDCSRSCCCSCCGRSFCCGCCGFGFVLFVGVSKLERQCHNLGWEAFRLILSVTFNLSKVQNGNMSSNK